MDTLKTLLEGLYQQYASMQASMQQHMTEQAALHNAFQQNMDIRKLIGARYYVGDSTTDTQNHGTHTASTTVGRVVKNANYFGIVNGTARGGVPSAKIATYKVCKGHCDSKDIMAAFDDAIADNVDIITISIGSLDPLNISEDVLAISSFHAMQKSILTVQASNSTNQFSIGEGNKQLVYGKEITRHCNESSAMQCIDSCVNSDLVKGKIVVCNVNQSDFGFFFTARDYNASGVIFRKIETDISDNVPFSIVFLNDSDFHYVESYLKSKTVSSARILKSETIHYPAPIVGFSSSKGPNKILPEFFKPDITAPGINILAESPKPNSYSTGQLASKYDIQSGTSMACPHVTGAVAYVKSMQSDWSILAIKSSIMSTAWTMNMKDNIDAKLGYGAGHIDLVRAIYPGLVYETLIDEYDNMLYSMGLEGDKLRKMIGVIKKCPKGIITSMKDLNYPAMTASVNNEYELSVVAVDLAKSKQVGLI
ncbi:subtilisin-like protease SBT4.3 [Impatiens glandulifera]|uniref:subtilisin-like protease SBT4.3 n=1 Tax=Impatiens glandulifera TaxID=253017 RepID=UPI001FB13364|nr:subtilisin-like protease SBT4.3 [Impatiens glandulifera]